MRYAVIVEPRTKPDTFSLRYEDPLTHKRVRVKAESKEAMRKAKNELEAMLLDYRPGGGKPKATPLVILEEYLTELLTCEKPRRQTTIDMKRKNLTPWLSSVFYMEQITTANIKDWAAVLKTQSRAPDTIAIRLRDLRAFVRWCTKQGILASNPFVGIHIPESTFVGRRLNLNELQGLYGNMTGNLKDAISIFLDTGCRRGELLQMEANDIDFERRFWLLRGKEGKSKSKRDRIIPLFDRALQILAQRRSMGLLFKGYTKNMLQNDWKKAKKASGIVGRLRIHDLRHTFASTFKGRRSALKAIAGWSTDHMMSHYQHVEVEELREDMEKSLGTNLGTIGYKSEK